METTRTYVRASRLTVERACEAWLLSKHALKPPARRSRCRCTRTARTTRCGRRR
jgi:hypothetical protein